MELRYYLKIIRAGWILLLALLLLGGGLGCCFALTRSPVYESESRVFVSPVGSSGSDLNQGGAFAQAFAKSYADLATTTGVLDKVVRELKLHGSDDSLARSVSADPLAGESVIVVTADDRSASRAAAIANVTARVLVSTILSVTPSGTKKGPAISARVVQFASVEALPVSPVPQLDIGLGALVGLALALAVLIVRDRVDTRVLAVEDLAEYSEFTILGVVGGRSRSRPRVVRDGVVRSGAWYRDFVRLRFGVDALFEENRPRVVLVTSSVSAEGKSTVALHLAASMAEVGRRTLLLDFSSDSEAEAFQFLEMRTSGLAEVAHGRATIDDGLTWWAAGEMFLMSGGHDEGTRVALLESDSMRHTIEQLRSRFEAVVIDSPSLDTAVDAIALARFADVAVLVVGSKLVRRDEVAASLEQLFFPEGANVGLALNLGAGRARNRSR